MKTIISLLSLKVIKEKDEKYNLEQRVTRPEVAHDVAIKVLEMHERPEEIMALITLDTKNKITGVFVVSTGTINASLVHPREIFKRAMLQNAASIILMHNHPSGDPDPSVEDIEITRRLVEAGNIIGISILDHVIIGDEYNFYSMAENSVGGL
ncbi:MAG TPA: DNA repair protein RadC [Bacteroidales bacterium]|nr:DNA repair protein RadC [Bacteroidales bacterium]